MRFPLFNSLRAIAALTIFAYHVAFALGFLGGRTLSPWLAQLNVGVPIFFLISGFLLYRPFAQARFDRVRMPAIGGYTVRRVLRIVPAYWLALTVISLWLGLDGIFSPRGVGTYYGFFQVYNYSTVTGGIGQAWTIDVEITFYALLPLCALLARQIPFSTVKGFVRGEGALLALLFAGGLAAKLIAIHNTPANPSSLSPVLYALPAFLDQFAIGMGLAVASVALAGRDTSFVRVIDRHPWLPWGVAGAAFYLVGTHIGPLGGGFGARLLSQHYLKAIVALGLLVPAVFGDPAHGLVRKLLANRALLWVGLVSYGVYLWHRAMITKLHDAGVHNSLALFVLALAATLAVAAVSWYGLERYALRLGRRLSRRRPLAVERPPTELEPAP
ncbi:MAG TPA: acyltransferase [Thermoleophilaceae bacterium]|nr:acyltransferase [Thermoleophilaceae bacterium]